MRETAAVKDETKWMRERIEYLEKQEGEAHEIFGMINEALEKVSGEPGSHTPPSFLNDWVHTLGAQNNHRVMRAKIETLEWAARSILGGTVVEAQSIITAERERLEAILATGKAESDAGQRWDAGKKSREIIARLQKQEAELRAELDALRKT